MHRRQFIHRAAASLAALTGTLVAAGFLRQFFPRIAGARRLIRLDHFSLYPVDTFTYLEGHHLFLYRDHEGISAVSAVCTHLGCTLLATMDGFECPCHGSCYTTRGEVISGPAPRKLSWYKVSGLQDGRIVIDPGTEVDAQEKFLIS